MLLWEPAESGTQCLAKCECDHRPPVRWTKDICCGPQYGGGGTLKNQNKKSTNKNLSQWKHCAGRLKTFWPSR